MPNLEYRNYLRLKAKWNGRMMKLAPARAGHRSTARKLEDAASDLWFLIRNA